ncbi:hypothetical protein SAMN04490244_1112 [Tranquillimonas rosea]|uniref:Uncharacterized protein n=1 Tax=Tranquillimonas rosea TaxID=641238 RepID=A0A1H9RSC4_9RHOB|nr:hypothetical protein [Tranquillimonas rosea]SER75730.1 hypothetical protein SAMN04490244_102440 [Tranquillimonas rosea]SES33532.1 hypothetical protein SAMN04490244_1112 [Tranquillimonas rosea]
MAEGESLPRFHLSSLDPGTGKTLLVKHFIKTLLSSSNHEEVAVLVCVSRLEEVDRMWVALEACQDEVAIWTGDEEVNAKSSTPVSEARVLLTTQQKLEAVCQGNSFKATTAFHYLGRPREVRIWDESFLPGTEGLLSSDDLGGLLGYFRRSAPELCSALENLQDELKLAAHGDILDVPSLEEMGGQVGIAEVQRVGNAETTSLVDKKRLERLCHAVGDSLPVHRNNLGEIKLLDYRDTLPDDLAPMMILDASGRCRETYALMESERQSLVRLPSAVKDYSNLKISLWAKGSSKASHWRDKEEVLIQGIAEAVMTRPDEEWLIFHHKELTYLRDRLEAYLPDGLSDQLNFLTWGHHHGTNAFAHVPNVILASLLFLPPEVYETRARLCAGTSTTETVCEKTCLSMESGELQNDVLQALCRASVRGMQAEGTCPPCRAWIIAAKATGLEDRLPELFPGCRVEPWRPTKATKLSGSIRKALDVIDRWTHEGGGDEIVFAEVAEAIGMSLKDFNKRVAKDPRFKRELAKRDFDEVMVSRQTIKGRRQAKGITQASPASPFIPDPEATFIV